MHKMLDWFLIISKTGFAYTNTSVPTVSFLTPATIHSIKIARILKQKNKYFFLLYLLANEKTS